MQIKTPIYNINFKGATLNINSFSDSHGNLEKLDAFYQAFEENKDEIFLDDKKGNQNALVVVGDFFIAGDTKGYKTNKNASSNDFQMKFFNVFINKLKGLVPKNVSYFIPGNHEFDAGEKYFKQILNSINAKVIASNLDFKNSPVLEDEIKNDKIFQTDILEIDDDKDPSKKHKALFLGISPVNIPAYKKGMKGIKFIDEASEGQDAVTKEDYERTFNKTIQLIEEFKKDNPKGLVIVSVHTGVDFAKNLANEMGDNISLILNGHEHKNDDETINGVNIINLSQNFEKFANIKLSVDDDGNLKSISEPKTYKPELNSKKEGMIQKIFYKVFCDDWEKEYKIRVDNPKLKSLDNEGVRYKNNYLANFITDSILSQIQKTNPDVDIFALNASSIRGSIDTLNAGGANNLQMIEVLGGITHKDAELYKNKVSGKELMVLIVDNLLFNETSPERKPLMQYSGLIIDKKSILDGVHSGKSLDELMEYVIFAKNGKNIETDKDYTIANTVKYFAKSKNKFINTNLFDRAQVLNLNAKDSFRAYIEENKDNLYAKCDIRIID